MQPKQQKPQVKLPQIYKCQQDTRTPNQILLSNEIAKGLTELNLQRIRNKHSESVTGESYYSYHYEFFFLCLTGIPPFQKEFENLDLPGDKIVFTPKQFSNTEKFTDQEYRKMYQQISLQLLTDRIHTIIQKILRSEKPKKLVLVFHSFGGFITTNYFRKYRQFSSQIFGYIDIGSIPITMYQIIKEIINTQQTIDNQTLLQNVDYIYQKYIQQSKVLNTYIPFSNKYHLAIFMKLVRDSAYHQLFEYARLNGSNLKLIMYGRKDNLFTESLLAQKAIHHSYIQYYKLPQDYKNKIQQSYKKIYNKEDPKLNVQQRFIFAFNDGKHSIHLQPKLISDISMAIRQYLLVLDQARV